MGGKVALIFAGVPIIGYVLTMFFC